MRVSDTHRVLFVHVPKTGGSTIDLIFDKEVDDARKVNRAKRHFTYGELLELEPSLSHYWSCGFVRNPWARMVSWWAMVVDMFDKAERGIEPARTKVEKAPGIWQPLGKYRQDFPTFVLEGTENVERLRVPQLQRLQSDQRGTVDFIGRVENFVHDVNVVRDKLGLEAVEELPRRNASTHGHYSEYYDDRTRERVAELYATDIEAFGYTFG
ncbi:MAG TPA: sulfotransferase family 2 domain-containing protein [Nocardioides sp.]|jgi:hypothetical protein|nr:sulfotransferase family 2 domain-containing protein [Nocardioides sp.]